MDMRSEIKSLRLFKQYIGYGALASFVSYLIIITVVAYG